MGLERGLLEYKEALGDARSVSFCDRRRLEVSAIRASAMIDRLLESAVEMLVSISRLPSSLPSDPPADPRPYRATRPSRA